MDNPTMNRMLRRLHASFGVPGRPCETDRQLLERFLGGDQDAFATLVTRHDRTVLSACRHVLADPADVDDAFQATFLVLFEKARQLGRQESIGRWLYTVAHRVAVHARANAARRRDREEAAGRQRQAEAAAPDLSWREACAVLHEELDRLPERFRLPLLLCYLQGQSRDEAAKNLGWTPGTVKGRLERGRQELADRLTRRGITLSAGLLAAAVASRAEGAGLPGDLVRRTVQAVVGGASAPVRALARGALPGVFAGKRAIASILLLTAMLGFGTRWFAAMSAARDEPPAPDKAAEKPAPAANSPGVLRVSGRVLDPDGKPVAGAKLFAPADVSERIVYPNNRNVRMAATTGADGRFTAVVELPRSDYVRPLLIAYAPGFGVNWVDLGGAKAAKLSEDLTIRLARDVPITGRVLNTEGRPLPGLSVAVTLIDKPVDDKLDDYLATWKRHVEVALYSPKEQLSIPLSRIIGTTTTDRDGRFTLRGAGAERIVRVLIRGGGIARTLPHVLTRPGFDPKPYNELLLGKENDILRVVNHFRGLFAPDFTLVVEAGRQLTGVATDSGTGQPIPGCHIVAFTGPGDAVDVETDERGRYGIDGVPKEPKGYRIDVFPPEGTDYLPPESPRTPDSEGYSPVRLDTKLAKGSVVTGRIVDKKTDKGVRGGVRFVPLAGNKFFDTRPEYRGYASSRGLERTDAEGRFRVATIPGPALVMARAFVSEKSSGGEEIIAYRAATPDPARKDLFQWSSNGWEVIAVRNSVEFLGNANAVKVVDVKETGETAVDLFVDPGAIVKLAVQDTDGRPLAGAWVAGIADMWRRSARLAEPTATVYALDPERPRNLIFYHPERHLGGTVTIDIGQKEPVIARLGPLARVTGRLLDTDGQPLAGATVEIAPAGQLAFELYRTAGPGGPPVAADKDGRFTLVDVLPGIALTLQYRKGQTSYTNKERDKPLSLKAGETRDLGELTLEPPR